MIAPINRRRHDIPFKSLFHLIANLVSVAFFSFRAQLSADDPLEQPIARASYPFALQFPRRYRNILFIASYLSELSLERR